MKIRTISRSRADHTKERAQDLQRVSRNLDPKLHPFARQREYVRAKNAVKLDKIFAKPFIGALDGTFFFLSLFVSPSQKHSNTQNTQNHVK